MINGLSFDIEDWFQVENLKEACPFVKWDSYELRVENNSKIILSLLEQFNQKATFFILGWIAERLPELVTKIFKCGHEIASHGYQHQLIYKLTPDEFRKDLILSKKILEGITKTEVIGYRAPNFSITKDSLWAIDILKELNFRYDSSIFPTSFHSRYGFNDIKNSDFFQFSNGLQEFPLTTFNICEMNFPLGGGAYFRFVPYEIFSLILNEINKRNKRFIFYLHPWELDKDQPRVRIKPYYYLRHYFNLANTERKLKFLLDEFKFKPLKYFLQ